MTTLEKIKQKKAELQELEDQLENEKNDPKTFILEVLGDARNWIADPGKYPNSVFFFNGQTCLLELEKTEDTTYLWCNYGKIWNPISEKFSLNNASIQELIKETVEEHFKLRDITPYANVTSVKAVVEEHFKLRDITPVNKNQD